MRRAAVLAVILLLCPFATAQEKKLTPEEQAEAFITRSLERQVEDGRKTVERAKEQLAKGLVSERVVRILELELRRAEHDLAAHRARQAQKKP